MAIFLHLPKRIVCIRLLKNMVKHGKHDFPISKTTKDDIVNKTGEKKTGMSGFK